MRTKSNNNNTGSKGSKKASGALSVSQVAAAEVGRNNAWRDLIDSFLPSQDVSESSRRLYKRTLTQYFVWVEMGNKPLSSLTRKDVLEYKDYLREHSLSSLTISSYITAVRKFYEWAEGEKLYPNIAKGIKTPRRQQAFKKQHLTDAKSKELL